jgi:hypothetical protein
MKDRSPVILRTGHLVIWRLLPYLVALRIGSLVIEGEASSKKDGGGAGWLPWLIIQFSLILFHSCWIKFCLLKVSRNMNTLHLNCIPEQFMDANVGKQNCPAKSELHMDSVYTACYISQRF